MTWMKFVTALDTGCCTVGELLQASKTDPKLKEQLKEWAIAEMKVRGIPITEA